jgi:hypothetical protein
METSRVNLVDQNRVQSARAVSVLQKKYAKAEPLLQKIMPKVNSHTMPDGPDKIELPILFQQEIGVHSLMTETLNWLGGHDEADQIAKEAFALVDVG